MTERAREYQYLFVSVIQAEQQPVPTPLIARRIYMSVSGVRWWLGRFERLGLVWRVSERGGWCAPDVVQMRLM